MTVFGLEKHHNLMLCIEKRARLLLKRSNARIHSLPTTLTSQEPKHSIEVAQGIERASRLLQHADGDRHLGNLITHLTQQIVERRFLLTMKDLSRCH